MHEGTAFVQTLTGGIGGRVPLGIGPGTVSILTLLDLPLVNSILDQNEPRFGLYNHAARTKVTRDLSRARELGYSFDIGETYPEERTALDYIVGPLVALARSFRER